MCRTNVRIILALLISANLVMTMPQTLFAGPGSGLKTTTPIKYVVVIFQENESFDHYFGTYPQASNPPKESPFYARPGAPAVNGLNNGLLNNNPNGATFNGVRARKPEGNRAIAAESAARMTA